MDCGEGTVLSPEVEREVIGILESGVPLPQSLPSFPAMYVAAAVDKSVKPIIACRHEGKVYKIGFKV